MENRPRKNFFKRIVLFVLVFFIVTFIGFLFGFESFFLLISIIICCIGGTYSGYHLGRDAVTKKLEDQEMIKTCPHCKTENPQDAKFCYKCGKKLEY